MPIELVRDLPTLEALAKGWTSLPADHPFATFGFARAWLAHFRESAEPFAIVRTDGTGTLDAVAAWAIVTGPGGTRLLTGVGARDAGLHDPIVRHAKDMPAFAGDIAGALRAARGQWDLLALVLRPAASGPLLASLPRVGWTMAAPVPWEQHAVIEFAAGWDAYWAERSRHFADTRRKARKIAQRPHRFYLASPARARDLMPDLFRLHAENLAALGDWRELYLFLATYLPDAVARGDACMPILEIDGKIAAIDLLLRSGPCCYGFLRALDPEFRHLGAGIALTTWALEKLAGDGVRTVDCGAGQHDWKARFATGALATVCVQVPVTPAGLLALDRAWLRRYASHRLSWARRLLARPAAS
ncbi:MAG: GNAT family N-acetyltransferase [Candidatus Sericytochromatia bacterium]|nr:GNAT family N-acetyltransferase [Candidatus Tanganyikabacteria bacterium]